MATDPQQDKAREEKKTERTENDEASSSQPVSLDPAVVDPEGTAAERAEGRTSDPQFRDEDASVDDPEPDLTLGSKPSDAGPERYPFPPGGDVEVALVDAGSGDNEFGPVLHEGHWVKLGFEDPIPERFRGAVAVVLESPWIGAAAGAENTEVRGYAYQPDKYGWRVRVRDETDAILAFPGDADTSVIFAGSGENRGDLLLYA